MPQDVDAKVRRRGGPVKIRTVRIGKGRYAHVYVVKRRGPRGGTTELGQIRKRKGG